MRKLRALTLLVAVLAIVCLLISGPGSKHGWFPWRMGLTLYQMAAYLGAAAVVLATIVLASYAMPRHRVGMALPVLSLCIGMAALAPPVIMRVRAQSVPPIHDITTDFVDPPQFVALKKVRDESPNGSKYGGEEIAARQREAYQDLHPGMLTVPPAEATQRVLDVVRAMGWEVIASDAAAGRIEATDTSSWFGFKDDVAIRVRADPNGSRVDIRSVSRVGRSDIGANASRIRDFLARLS